MKKLLYILVAFWVFSFGGYAQEQQSDHKGSVLSGGTNFKDIGNNLQMQFQIGSVFQYPLSSQKNIKTAFPFGVLYLPNTFSDKTFEVSKGYYADKIKINWSIGANQDNIEKIQILRKELIGDGAYNLIATIGKDVFEYEDAQTEGGVLYQYKVIAVGVSNIEQKYLTYIEGVGFRSPTANVSGSISFEGGSPVQDVKVLAEPVGSEGGNGGTSLYISSFENFMRLTNFSTQVSTQAFTIQAWYAFDDTNKRLFEFDTDKGDKLYFEVHRNNNNLEFILTKSQDVILNYTLKNSYPNGEVDAFGNDAFNNINSIDTNTFIHYSLVFEHANTPMLYINGREITPTYIDNIELENQGVSLPELIGSKQNYSASTNDFFTNLKLGNNFTGYIDELRLWSRTLTNNEVRRDFKRYINGSEAGLEAYLRFDEGGGEYAYDISRKGYQFNKNNASKVNIINANDVGIDFSQVRPTKEQLGIFGVTAQDGSYTISSIPYAGNGEQFKITPSLGVHKFKPASKTLFLGKDEPVANQVDFEDISSFVFKGRVVYNVQNVFSASTTISDPGLQNITEIREHGYNQYLVNGSIIVNKGNYYYEANEGETISTDINGNLQGGTLKEYPVIGLEGASLYIDGDLVFDEDNQAILSDSEGKFSINVPIGRHKIEVKKQGHTFVYEGRFPEKTNSSENDLFDFYEDQVQERWFIDNTRVTLVGRVVGGQVQSNKPIAFGINGLYEHTFLDADNIEQKEIISSKNNIGKATLIFKGNKNTNSLDKIVETNEETGEYRVDLIPFIYHIKDNGGITVATNTNLNGEFLDSDEELNFISFSDEKTTSYTTQDGIELESPIAYNFVKNFRYNSPVSLEIIEQESDAEIKLEEEKYSLVEAPVAFYTQKKKYKFTFEVSQDYINYDVTPAEKLKEYYEEGEFVITNNLEVGGKSKIETKRSQGKVQYEYSFQAGIPNITQSDNFEQSINIEYKPQDVNAVGISNSQDFKSQGVILGAKPTDGTIFSTVAPDTPDIILRDPPGSNSFASIESGTSISFESSVGAGNNSVLTNGLNVSLGPDITVSTGAAVFFTDLEIDAVLDTSRGITTTINSTENNTTIQTYTFNQTISTSDDKDFVGASGDLYIGNSKNVYYGMIDKVEFSKEVPSYSGSAEAIPNIPVTIKDKDDNEVQVYLGARKTYFIAEQPSETFFVYSQNYILSTLIPGFESLANSLDAGTPPDPNEEYQSSNFYRKQIDLWKKIIQENERKKYLALNDKDKVKQDINAVINQIENDNEYKNELVDLLNGNFFVNRSFDAGVGEYTSAYTTTAITSRSYEKTIDIDKDFADEIGLYVNGVGASMSFSSTYGKSKTDATNSTNETSTAISYTLRDPDKFNALSVDVVNLFDGSGAVFMTKGGYTSCPYEEETVSEFYEHQNYDANVIGTGGESLSAGTLSVYESTITAEKTTLTGIPENEDAVFDVKLKNLSPTQEAVEYKLYVEYSTLGGAETNIEQGGVPVFLPYNETVSVPVIISKNSSSSVYTYEGIKVYLGDPCEDLDDFLESSGTSLLELSVEFNKSCSKVAISAPEMNYVFNRSEAFNQDTSGAISNNVIPVTFTDFNTGFSGFRKIDLQYRNANAASWSKFKSYYATEQLRDEAGDTAEGVVIGSETEFTYNWDVIGSNITDGDYELRAVSYCTDNVEFVSDVVTLTINLTAPELFGTPEPTDGILDIGDDIKVRFNEPIQTGDFTNIIVRGLQNQQAIDHSVSVSLDGSANQIELPQQNLGSKSFSIQFWMHSSTSGNGVLLSKENGPKISLNGSEVAFELAGETITATINDSQYNFYSFIYKDGTNPYLEILENGTVLQTLNVPNELSFGNTSSLYIGGENVLGNLHDFRLWSIAKTAGSAAAEKDKTLSGRENNLIGYWPLNEGNGIVGFEKVRNKNANVQLNWTIKPKTEAYEFTNNQYLILDNVGYVNPTHEEDITVSFWLKASPGDTGTIFSNGLGTDTTEEPILTNGFRNKWALDLTSSGTVVLTTENVEYTLSNNSLADNLWHHVAIVVKRKGSINSYIDGEQNTSVSSENIGGIAGAKIALGAKLNQSLTSPPTYTDFLTGKLDELRVWNVARSLEQIKRDRYFEIDNEAIGLLLYANFKEADATVVTKGPRYFVKQGGDVTSSFLSELGGGTAQNFAEDSPAVKPVLKLTNVPFSTVINGDEIIINPDLTNELWSLYEGQILDITVAKMNDVHFNEQQSPISFTAFVNRQEVEWYTASGTKVIDDEKELNAPYSFTMDVVNKGGNNQSFMVEGLPNWMTVSTSSGNVAPNSTKKLTFTVDSELAMGAYNSSIYLQLTNGYSDRLDFNLRVLQLSPDWSVNPSS